MRLERLFSHALFISSSQPVSVRVMTGRRGAASKEEMSCFPVLRVKLGASFEPHLVECLVPSGSQSFAQQVTKNLSCYGYLSSSPFRIWRQISPRCVSGHGDQVSGLGQREWPRRYAQRLPRWSRQPEGAGSIPVCSAGAAALVRSTARKNPKHSLTQS